MTVDNFVVLDSVYGKFIVPRTCLFQAEALVKTGRTHIESELNNIFAIVDTLPAGSIVVDGGCNAGFFSIPVAHRTQGRDIKIIAFEPQRQLFQAVGGSLALNGYRHVFLHNCGLGETTGIAQLPAIDYSVAQDFGTVQLSDDTTVKEDGWMNDRVVDITSIDAMDLPRLDFFKLDVEGYEVPALRGALKTIQQHRPWIWVEYFITGVEPIKQSLSILDDYAFFIVDYQNMLCAPREKLANITTVGLKEL
jgi:FkbM family methyltransferase